MVETIILEQKILLHLVDLFIATRNDMITIVNMPTVTWLIK